MTEKEKAQAGYLYNANYDEEILKDIYACNDLCYEFNQIRPSDREAQTKLLAKIFGTMGKNVYVLTSSRSWLFGTDHTFLPVM